MKIPKGDGQEDKLVKMIRTTCIAIALTALIACGDKPAATAPKVIKQKIAVGSVAPAAAAVTQAVSVPAAVAEDVSVGQSEEQATAVKEEKATSDLIQESLKIASSYNPEGRFDPFEPLFKEEPQELEVTNKKGERQRRVPQTPLERISLSQLKISAIIRAVSGNRGLVEDATGKGYVVEKGTYIGLNSGKVMRIEPDRILIEEEIENIMGELVIQNTELKLQKTAGEL